MIKYDPLAEEIEVNLIEDDEAREETPTVGYYAMFEYQNGFRKTLYWTKKKMLTHADKYSQAFSKEAYQKLLAGQIPQEDMWKYSSFWYKDFDGMAYKTMLRQLISKWGIMSTEMQEGYSKDMAVLDEKGNPYFIENDQEQKADNIIIKAEVVNAEQDTTGQNETINKIQENTETPMEEKEQTPEEMLENAKKTKARTKKQETIAEEKSIEDEFFS